MTFKTAPKHYYYHLDFIRFFVVLFVLIHHWVSATPFKILPFASTVAFVLSAFLLTKNLLLEKEDSLASSEKKNILKRYFTKRSLRIFPVYYALLIVAYLVNWKEFRNHIIPYVFFYQNYPIGLNNRVSGGLGHTWSIAVQEQFYLILPFIILFFKQRAVQIVFCLMIAIGILSRLYYFSMDYPFRYNHFLTECTLDCFGIGCITAFLYIYHPTRFRAFLSKNLYFYLSVILYLLSFILLKYRSNLNVFSSPFYTINDITVGRAAMEGFNNLYRVFERLLVPLISVWLIGWGMFDMYSPVIKAIHKNSIILFLSKISYGIYLYHFPVFSVLRRVLSHFNFQEQSIMALILYFIVTVTIATLSYYIVENPILKWYHRKSNNR